MKNTLKKIPTKKRTCGFFLRALSPFPSPSPPNLCFAPHKTRTTCTSVIPSYFVPTVLSVQWAANEIKTPVRIPFPLPVHSFPYSFKCFPVLSPGSRFINPRNTNALAGRVACNQHRSAFHNTALCVPWCVPTLRCDGRRAHPAETRRTPTLRGEPSRNGMGRRHAGRSRAQQTRGRLYSTVSLRCWWRCRSPDPRRETRPSVPRPVCAEQPLGSVAACCVACACAEVLRETPPVCRTQPVAVEAPRSDRSTVNGLGGIRDQ